MRILDEQGQERDREWLETMFGPQVRVDATEESPAFRVVKVRASTSDTAIVTVLDEEGNPVREVAVVYAHTSGAHVVREETDHNGQIALLLDREYRYGVPAQAGPCHAGIPRKPTDVIYGLGEVRVAGGDNRHLDITFQWEGESDTTTTPEIQSVDGNWQTLFEKLDRIIALLESQQS
jgi:hypothetical protein